MPDIFEFSDFVDRTITDIENEERELLFTFANGDKVKMYHDQECCEDVYIDDICGDLEDLLNSPVIIAREAIGEMDTDEGHMTWTFYIIATRKGSVTLRWTGESNGYYSESVSLEYIHRNTVDDSTIGKIEKNLIIDAINGIEGGFLWRNTEQGIQYWDDVIKNLKSLAEGNY